MINKTYVVLLRGVMPVGKNKVPMAKLRDVLTKAGFKNVRTYIASGNVLVDAILSTREVERTVRELIKKRIGPDLVVIVRTGGQLKKLSTANPFTKSYDLSRVFFTSFDKPPSPERIKALLNEDVSPDEIVFAGNSAYVYIPGPYVKGKFANNILEKRLGVSATTRNYSTVSKLIEMSSD